jgi:hypothetical protein
VSLFAINSESNLKYGKSAENLSFYFTIIEKNFLLTIRKRYNKDTLAIPTISYHNIFLKIRIKIARICFLA